MPAYVVYSYIRIKAEQNGYTVTKQIEKFSKYVDKKEKVKFNRHANKIESNRRMLENDIHRHWESLFASCTEEMANDKYEMFKDYFSRLNGGEMEIK